MSHQLKQESQLLLEKPIVLYTTFGIAANRCLE